MNPEQSSEPPEEPLSVSEPHTLSPASPKPIHFPAPTNIPVLEMQMDVGFNQTELHMSDPAMHNTEVRSDFWRDLDEKQSQELGYGSQVSMALINQEPEGSMVTQAADSIEADPSSQQANSSIPTSHPFNEASPSVLTEENASSSLPEGAISLPAQHIVTATQILDSLEAVNPLVASNTAPDVQARLAAQAIPIDDLTDLPNKPHAPPAPTQLEHDHGGPIIHDVHVTQVIPSDADIPPIPDMQSLLPTTHDENTNHDPENSQNFGNAISNIGLQTAVDVLKQRAVLAHAASSTTTPVPDGTTEESSQKSPAPHFVLPPLYSVTDLGSIAQETSQTNSHANNTPIESRRETKMAAGQALTEDDHPWNADIQRKYDHFIEEERKYVSEGRWEQFPPGSRLFVGNLSSEKVTKRDIFHIFHHYGNLAQISIKQAYGFVQFLRAEDCVKALNSEQGTQIRDKRIHLEVSKPQKGRGPEKNKERRSRSPDHRRVGKPSVDRYVSGSQPQSIRGRRGSNNRRSPTPPRYRDRYNDRYRDPSPDTYGRNRYRSPSPKRDADEDLPLPRRAPRDVPDVQILVLDNLERDFISWVENAFSSKGVRVDVLLLSPRLSEQAVLRRQIVEGVIAVSKLVRRNQDTGKIGLQIFDRSAGVNNIKFEEYDHLDPPICAELVLRAKKTQQPIGHGNDYGIGQYSNAPAPSPSRQYPRYNAPPNSYSQPNATSPSYPPNGFLPTNTAMPPANLQHLISSLDPSGLQNLLSAMNRPQSSNAPPPSQGYANAPGAYGNLQQQQHSAALAALQQNPQALASLLQQPPPFQGGAPPHSGQASHSQPSVAGPGPVNMQDILARLGTYKP